MRVDGLVLWRALDDPHILDDLDGLALSNLVRLAWQQAVAPALGHAALQDGILPKLPELAAKSLSDLAVTADAANRKLQYEIERIEAALRNAAFPILVLKGAAYHAAKLSFSKSRMASDVDILVPHENLTECEQMLKDAGWEMEAKSAYAEMYYRKWMHELPPMRHSKRLTIIDVHHTILPPVARLTPSPQALIDKAVETDFGALKRPSHADLFVHAALHCFYDGDFTASLRALHDLRCLVAAAGDHEATLIDHIIERAHVHDAKRPVADSLAFLQKEAKLALSASQAAFVTGQSRPAFVQNGFFWAIRQRSFKTAPFQYGDNRLAAFALYVRSHWITMPPVMLARHTATRLYQRARGLD